MSGSKYAPPSGSARLCKDRNWSEYPIGTKAHAYNGGHWTKMPNGWKWFCGDTFAMPGGDAIGACIELPNMYTYYNNCVNWPASDVYASGGLSDMVQSGITITRRTFQHNVGASVLAEFELNMGYPCGQLTMKDDYAVSYHRGKLHGLRVYWVSHSAIEYVFVPEDYLNKK